VQKNKARDEARLAKRKKIVAILFIVGIVIVVFWIFVPVSASEQPFAARSNHR